jgi:hypothetical protein
MRPFWESTNNANFADNPDPGRRPEGSVKRRSERAMRKTELLERTRAAHGKLVGALDGLTEEMAARVGVTSQWSVKDVLAHITAWELEGARAISEIQAGTYQPQKFTRERIDQFNAQATGERKDRLLAEARAEFDAAHRRMEQIIASLPDEVDTSSLIYRFIEGVTFKHHAHHAAQIEEWRKKQG